MRLIYCTLSKSWTFAYAVGGPLQRIGGRLFHSAYNDAVQAALAAGYVQRSPVYFMPKGALP